MVNNPFDITKAVDYTDAEIYKYWVDLGNENQGFEGLIKPDTLMPMIIVGSKGSGKTHVMKYFSYELQKIRCMAQSASMQEELAREKFIGIYIRCSGFNSDKFIFAPPYSIFDKLDFFNLYKVFYLIYHTFDCCVIWQFYCVMKFSKTESFHSFSMFRNCTNCRFN